MTQKNLWQLDATETAERTRAGDLTALAVTQAAVDRMHAVNPQLNAVVADLGAQALERAALLDKQRAAGEDTGPLHGVPVTIKVNIDQAGQATTNGVPTLENHIAPEDAPVVRNFLNAGAVVSNILIPVILLLTSTLIVLRGKGCCPLAGVTLCIFPRLSLIRLRAFIVEVNFQAMNIEADVIVIFVLQVNDHLIDLLVKDERIISRHKVVKNTCHCHSYKDYSVILQLHKL